MYIEMGVRYTILTSSKNSKILKENKNNLCRESILIQFKKLHKSTIF